MEQDKFDSIEMEQLTTKQLRDELTRRGYYTGNLWHIVDVQDRFDVTDDQAMTVLDEVFNGEWLTGVIFECIDDCATERKLNKIEQ